MRSRRNIYGTALTLEKRIEDCLVVGGDRLLDVLPVLGQKIDAQLVGVFHEVSARIPVTLGELVEELLEADFDPRHKNFSIAAGNQDLLIDGLLECRPYVWKHRLFFALPATGIWRWTAFLPLLVLRRTTRADLVLFGRGAL